MDNKSYKDKFNDLKNSITTFTTVENELPLGDKLKDILKNNYNKLLTDEIEEFSELNNNDVLKNLVHKYNRDDESFSQDNNFSDFYKTYIKNMNQELEDDHDLDLDELSNLLNRYELTVIKFSENIKKYESELFDFFIKLDKIKEWIKNIPEEVTINETEIFEQIKYLEDSSNIKDKIKKYKQERLKYFYLKHYYLVNPFLSLAQETDLYNTDNLLNDYNVGYDEEYNENITNRGFFGSIINKFF